jgi:formamidopyrimidine-DNA glycosylase
MPELPEVERAAEWLRVRAVGRRVAALEVLHPAVGRALAVDADARLRGRVVAAVERRGKHQFVRVDDGQCLHVHFRMAGDWAGGAGSDALPRHARAVLRFDDGSWVALVDPRALSTIALRAEGDAGPALGPDATDAALDVPVLQAALRARGGPIKPVLLDQRVLAGVGNIYAAEGLFRAGIHPCTPANRLGARRLARLLDGLRAALAAGTGSGRYATGESGTVLRVYGREGEPCATCGAVVRRITQAGRSTYFCARCQRR